MRALTAALLLAATVEPAAPSWSVARSPHFEVYATGNPSRATEALKIIEDVRAFYSGYFHLPDSTRAPIRVIVFSGDKEYAPFRSNESGDAFYQPSRDRDYIVMKDLDNAFQTIAHEYAHAWLGLRGVALPPFLAEGLAEFFSTVSVSGTKARLGSPPNGRAYALSKGRLMPLAELLSVRRDSETYNNSNHAGLFYAESWALTHLLMVDPKYRDGGAKYIALVQSGRDAAAAFAEVFGKDTDAVDKDFRTYVRRANYAWLTLDVPRTAPAAVTAPVAVPPFDATLVLADLLASQIGKDLDARAMLDQLTREQPDHLGLIELRAFFEFRTQGMAAAEPFFRRAIDAGSRNPALLAQYALRVGQTEPDRALPLITQAMALAPDDVEIRIHAAAIQIRRQAPDEALKLLAPITRVPSNLEFEYYQIVANGHAMAGDFEKAGEAAARVVAAARTPEETAFAASFASTIGHAPEVTKMIEGRIRNLNCDAAVPILEIAGAGATVRLAIDDPAKIVIAGGSGLKLDLDCGPQDVAARVGYSDIKPPDGTSGRVRFLDLKKK